MNDEIKIIAEKILLHLQKDDDYKSNRKFIEDELTIFRDGIRKAESNNRTNDRGNENKAADRIIIGTYPIYSAENYFTPDERIAED